jgi:hypothetical protein
MKSGLHLQLVNKENDENRGYFNTRPQITQISQIKLGGKRRAVEACDSQG